MGSKARLLKKKARRWLGASNLEATGLEARDWLDLSHMLIYHGRAICLARKPLCEECALNDLCPSAFIAKSGLVYIPDANQ